jgi:hypothetical protein
LLPYYTAFLDFLARISWPILIFVIACMFRSRLGNIVEAISQRVANLVELRGFGGRAIFGGTVGPLDEAPEKLVLPPPKKKRQEG